MSGVAIGAMELMLIVLVALLAIFSVVIPVFFDGEECDGPVGVTGTINMMVMVMVMVIMVSSYRHHLQRLEAVEHPAKLLMWYATASASSIIAMALATLNVVLALAATAWVFTAPIAMPVPVFLFSRVIGPLLGVALLIIAYRRTSSSWKTLIGWRRILTAGPTWFNVMILFAGAAWAGMFVWVIAETQTDCAGSWFPYGEELVMVVGFPLVVTMFFSHGGKCRLELDTVTRYIASFISMTMVVMGCGLIIAYAVLVDNLPGNGIIHMVLVVVQTIIYMIVWVVSSCHSPGIVYQANYQEVLDQLMMMQPKKEELNEDTPMFPGSAFAGEENTTYGTYPQSAQPDMDEGLSVPGIGSPLTSFQFTRIEVDDHGDNHDRRHSV